MTVGSLVALPIVAVYEVCTHGETFSVHTPFDPALTVVDQDDSSCGLAVIVTVEFGSAVPFRFGVPPYTIVRLLTLMVTVGAAAVAAVAATSAPSATSTVISFFILIAPSSVEVPVRL